MKIRLENSIDLLGEDPTKDKTETSRWEPTQQISLLSVDRAVDRQRSDFRPLGKRSTGRRPARSTEKNREHCSCSRSTGRSTEVHSCTLVHVGRPTEQFSSASGRPAGRPAKGKRQVCEYILKSKNFQ